MAKHPIIRDQFRTFLAHRNVITLVLLYIVITALFSLFVAVMWTIGARANSSFVDEIAWKLWYSFVFIYGYQPELPSMYSEGSQLVSVPLSVASIAFPTLLLGAVVFKILLPNEKIVIFRNKLSLTNNGSQGLLHINFYIGSNLRFINLDTKIYARTFTRHLRYEFPLRTHILETEGTALIPLPYSLVPTRVNLPILVNADEIDSDDIHAQMIFTNTDKLRLVKVNDMEIIGEDGDECELIIVVTGTIPELDSDFVEFHRYLIPDDVNYPDTFEIMTEFDLKNERSTTKGWDKF